MTRLDLKDVVAELAGLYPPGPQLTDALAILVWEAVGYLIDDEVRQSLFDELQGRIGLSAAAIAAAPDAALLAITRRGGMHPDKRAARLQETARIVLETCAGDLGAALAGMAPSQARRLMKSFPGVGDPGADRILLFGGYETVPAVDSNGLRALVRMGFCMERSSGYGATYRDAVGVLAAQGEPDRAWLMQAYQVLRDHGRVLCKRTRPQCMACPLDEGCAHSVTSQL
jgi:endonuclease III